MHDVTHIVIVLWQDLMINIKGINIWDPTFPCERDIQYNHYHLEITATSDQVTRLKKRLLARGLAIAIKRFNWTKYQQADQATVIQYIMSQSDCESEDGEILIL